MSPVAQRAIVLACAAALTACATPNFGEVLVRVDTDAPVPSLVQDLRVDLYDERGTWFDSRTFTTLRSDEWPLSFAISTDTVEPKRILVRLRGFPEQGTRDYRGERYAPRPSFTPPVVADSLEALCAGAPLLPPGQERTLRRGGHALTLQRAQADCLFTEEAGAVAANVHVDAPGTYRFEVVRAVPDAVSGAPLGDTVLFLRRRCVDRDSQVGCNDNIDKANGIYLSRLIIDLEPGDYTILTGGALAFVPADLTLRWTLASAWSEESPATVPAATPVLPRLVVDGVDRTPADEPDPLVTIDRLVEATVRYGEVRTLPVLLAGECAGTMADLLHRQSCIDTSTQLAALPPDTSSQGIDRGGLSRAGSFIASPPCAIAPRAGGVGSDGQTLLDDEVCIPGGAFVFGDTRVSGFERMSGTPRQVVVLEPFLLDRYEVTVARYRQALRDGFVGADDGFSPLSAPDCSFTGDASGPKAGIAREHHPLDCMSWYNARALCRFWGGDLPTAVQWEYAALASSRDHKTLFPWGDEAPTCDRALHGRRPGGECPGTYAVEPVDAAPWVTGDVTADGVVGLAGNAIEWVQDSYRAYTDACWQTRTLRGVGCFEDEAPERILRGYGVGSSSASLNFLGTNAGFAPIAAAPTSGFRCMRRGAP